MNLTDELAHLLVETREGAISDAAIETTECVLIDHLAAGIYGSTHPWSKIIAANALRYLYPASVGAPLYGRSEACAPAVAARINGAASHGFELDDHFGRGHVHPGSVIISAALASAAVRDASGRDLLEAIVIGYEALGRVALACGTPPPAFHTTALQGPFGSVAAVARILGFDARQLSNAWGIAGSFCAGLKAFQTGGGDIKRLHPGKAAEEGVIAAELTADGLTGPRDIFGNPAGFFAGFASHDADPEQLVTNYGSAFIVEETYFKPYAACSVTHPVVNSIRELRKRTTIDLDDIDRIIIGTSKRGVDQNNNPNPTDTMSVQYSIQCAAALAFLSLEDQPDNFLYDRYTSSSAPQLAQLVELKRDNDIEAAYPEKIGARVTVCLKDGSTLEALDPGLEPIRGPKERRDFVERKFQNLTCSQLTSHQQRHILNIIRNLRGGAADVRKLVTHIAIAHPGSVS